MKKKDRATSRRPNEQPNERAQLERSARIHAGIAWERIQLANDCYLRAVKAGKGSKKFWIETRSMLAHLGVGFSPFFQCLGITAAASYFSSRVFCLV
jgi:hypothetical protein